jgi:hypothetical protein
MIRFLRHEELDFNEWDRCITTCANPLVYAESWYLNIVSPGWSGLVKDEYTAVFPLPTSKKWGITYCHQPPFSQQLGVFGELDSTPFLKEVPSNYRLIDLQLNSLNVCHTGKIKERPNLVLDLNLSLDVLRRSFSENIVRNIRKAGKAGLQFDKSTDIPEIISLFRQYRGRSISTMKNRDYETLIQIGNSARQRGRLEVHGVRSSDGTLQAGAVFLRSGHGWIFLFSAVHPDGRETGAMSALLERFISMHAGEKCVLDFEGSSDPNLYRFYKSFGSKENVYLQLRINRLPFPFSLIKP